MRTRNFHTSPGPEKLAELRKPGLEAKPLVVQVTTSDGELYYPVFLPFDARIICPWCLKESAISTYSAHTSGPRMCEKAPKSRRKNQHAGGPLAADEYFPTHHNNNDTNAPVIREPLQDNNPITAVNIQNEVMLALRQLLGNNAVTNLHNTTLQTNPTTTLQSNNTTHTHSPSKADTSDSSLKGLYEYRSSDSSDSSSFSEPKPKRAATSKQQKQVTAKKPAKANPATKKATTKKTATSTTRSNARKRPAVDNEAPVPVPRRATRTGPATRNATERLERLPESAVRQPARARKPPPPDSPQNPKSPVAASRPAATRHNRKSPPPTAARRDENDGLDSSPENDDGHELIEHLPGGVQGAGANVDPDIELVNQINDE